MQARSLNFDTGCSFGSYGARTAVGPRNKLNPLAVFRDVDLCLPLAAMRLIIVVLCCGVLIYIVGCLNLARAGIRHVKKTSHVMDARLSS
jgi:hypothetical protein